MTSISRRLQDALDVVEQRAEGVLSENPLARFAYQHLVARLRRQNSSTGLPDLQDLLMQNMLEETVAGCEPPVGLAGQVLSQCNIESSLAQVPHLGSLANSVRIRATRLDYVRLWIDVLFQIKNEYPGLGLNSPHNSSRKDGLTRLEILQSWVILSNCGHLFRTFSTERALLYILLDGGSERSQFMRFIEESKPHFGENSQSIVDKGDYLSFYYVLTSWRLLRGDLQGLTPRRTIRAAWRLFFDTYRSELDSDRILHWTYRKSRQIVTAYLHSVMRIGPSLVIERDELIKSILHGGSIVGYSSSVPQTDVSLHLTELESLHLRVFFTSTASNLLSLTDMRKTQQWWRSRTDLRVDERISLLFTEPPDWPDFKPLPFYHFFRLYLPADTPRERWVREVQRWKECHWTTGDFHVSLAGREGLHCDVYMNSASPDVKALCRSARIIANLCESPLKLEDQHRLETSVAVMGTRLLSELIRGEAGAYIRPVPSAAEGGVGLAAMTASRKSCQHAAGEFARGCTDEVRKRELEWFYRNAGNLDVDGSPVASNATLLFIGKLIIFNRRTGDEITDVDLVWASFHNDEITWVLCQLKEGQQTGGDLQLEKLRKYIPALGEVQRVPGESSTKCWAATLHWTG